GPTREVLVGNHTLQAALSLGWREVDVYFVDVDEERARRIALADNRTSDLAGYDVGELAALLEEMGDLAGTGYEQADLDGLLDELAAVAPLADDDVPARPQVPQTRPGELLELGPHRLVCGDARDPVAYERLLDGERPRVAW